MDEKELVPENPSEAITESSGNSSAPEPQTDTSDPQDKTDVQAAQTTGAADLYKDSDPVSNVRDTKTDPKLQNHVDQDKVGESGDSAKESGSSNSAGESKGSENQHGDMDKEIKCETDDNMQDQVKDTSVSESTLAENSPKTVEQQLDGKEPNEVTTSQNEETIQVTSETRQLVSTEGDNTDVDKDKANNKEEMNKMEGVLKPEFETAPNVSIDESQDDHTQALDPFDVLLKDRTGSAADTSSPNTSSANTSTATTSTANTSTANTSTANTSTANTSTANTSTANKSAAARVKTSVNVGDNNEDHNTDNVEREHVREEEEQEQTGELVEAPGADEEVCLLPDTEREISEADKAEAEKVLAEKRKLAEAAATAMETVPKEENDTADVMPEESINSEGTGEPMDTEMAGDDQSQENGAGDKEPEEVPAVEGNVVPNTIQEICSHEQMCAQCKTEKSCNFRFVTKDGENRYICADDCIELYQAAHPGQYTVASKKYLIEEIIPVTLTCSECEEKKICYFYYYYDGEHTNYCSMSCLHSMMADEKDKYRFKRRRITVEQITPVDADCVVCNELKKCSYTMIRYGETLMICEQTCIKNLNFEENGRYWIKKKRLPRKINSGPPPASNPPLLKLKVISNATDKYLDEAYKIQGKTSAMVQAARDERERTFIRRCTQCTLILDLDDKMLTWETMDFCNEVCLGRHQNKVGSRCANCKNNVQHTSLGKYCVRFGYDIRQFCNSACLEEFKKGLKICCYCQRDISVGHQGFLAPVGDKGQFKDFCTQICMEKFDQMSKNPIPQPIWAKCAVCSLEKATTIEVEVSDDASQRLCSDPCFAAFKFVNNIFPDQCRWCKKFFERKQSKCYTIYEGNIPQCFCSKSCMNVFISNSRHIVPCNWCKVKKYNFDMIRRTQANGQAIMMCSLNCLNLYQVSVNAVSSRRTKCDMCKRTSLAQYHLTMSDATVRNFCTYQCVMSFQSQYSKHAPPLVPGESIDQPKAVPTGAPRRTYSANQSKSLGKGQQRSVMPVISNVQSLAAPPPLMPSMTRAKSKRLAQPPPPEPEPPAVPKTPPPPPKPPTPPPPPPPKVLNHVIVKTLPPQEVANKGTMTKPMTVSKGVSCRPHPCTKETQTDPSLERRVLIPVPVPIYVPVPCAMWSLPFPVPIPIPLPIPTPVFVPTTRNSAKGIMKEINKIHDKMPTDPFEAELLMMAEMVAGDKKKDQSDSDTDDDNDDGFSPVGAIDGNHAFGEDMLQMALKMATEYEDQPVDLESAMTANTITPSSHPGMPGLEGEAGMHHHHMMVLEQQRAVAALRASSAATAPRKRTAPPPAATRTSSRSKRSRRSEPAPPPQPDPPREPAEKPDANMCLKYTFGVNAWKQWVMTKNAEIEKSSIRRKAFKSEILQLTADELNYSLCLFVKEVRKPNGSEYAPDTIYYLVLGIQQYLFENGRIDNIFTDPYYEKFTDCLDEVARKFSVLYNDSQYIVTRVEEEHLWESKQLGAHSPHVLLSTLMFFNTKHFNLVTVEEHMQLSFSHIMKHWKRNPNQPGQAKIPGSRNVLLRFYPPQSTLANSRKKKVYEQQENEENPLRCPVKLYEFYISKCPESVRTRNDVFYLQPERSCVPDSPVWYSTQPLSRAALAKMLHRVKMVKEINIALLTS